MYKLHKNPINGEFIGVINNNAFVPFDPDNTDAKEFAKWLSEGGVPEATVEGEEVSAEWITETIAKLS